MSEEQRMQTSDNDWYLPPGLLLQAAIKPDGGGVVTLARHGALHLERTGKDAVYLDAEAIVARCGFYRPWTIESGYEPFDQPSPTAYLPLTFADLTRIDMEEGSFLYQREPSHEELRGTAIHDGRRRFLKEFATPAEVQQELTKLLETAGCQADTAQRCAATFLASFEGTPR